MDKPVKVSIRRCPEYDTVRLPEVIELCIKDLGGFNKEFKSAKNILLKPNLLSASNPELAITTHPYFIESVIKTIKKYCAPDAKIIIADSPGVATPHTIKDLKRLYTACGLTYLMNRNDNVFLNLDDSYEDISYTEGTTIKQLQVIKPVLEADIIINLPKFKTHSLTKITGAVKNMFGILYGRTKTVLHTKFMDIEKFSNMNLDVFLYSKPVISIMDGIIGMEGEGPGARGKPKKVGLVLASESGVALDNIMSGIMGFNKEAVPVLDCAKKRGISGASFEDIEIISGKGTVPNLGEYVIQDYIRPDNSIINSISKNSFLNNRIFPFIRNTLSLSPYQNFSKCNMCGTCMDICPEDAIKIDEKDSIKLLFNYKKCIRCYCCSEMCPNGAVDLKYSFLGNLIFGKKTKKI